MFYLLKLNTVLNTKKKKTKKRQGRFTELLSSFCLNHIAIHICRTARVVKYSNWMHN